MGSDSKDTKTETRTGRPWMMRVLMVLFLVVSLGIAYLVAVALVPRWWGQFIGDRVDGRITVGTGYGLTLGFLCTLFPLAVARQAFRGVSWAFRAVILLVAAALALPNLMTLGIVWGTGNGAHAGERILDVDGPGFRTASAFGAAGAAVVFLLYVAWGVMKWRDARVVAQLNARQS